jgi:hypothetical protein
MNARSQLFFRRSLGLLAQEISNCLEVLANIDAWEKRNPDTPPMDRGRFLVRLARARKAAASLQHGRVRECLERDEPIPWPVRDW